MESNRRWQSKRSRSSILLRRQLRQQVRPVAFDDAAHLWINGLDAVELLDLGCAAFDTPLA